MDEATIWKYIAYILQNRITQNVNNFEALTLTKQAGVLFVSRIWEHTCHRQGMVGFKVSFQGRKAL